MSFAVLYSVVRLVLDALLSRRRSELRLQAEVLALRHQLGVLQRQVRRARWQPADRLLLAALSRLMPRDAWSALLVSPETLLRWHRELVRRKWAAFRVRPRRRSAPRRELHELILRLARENPRWGYRRIQGEILKLGLRCSHLTVATRASSVKRPNPGKTRSDRHVHPQSRAGEVWGRTRSWWRRARTSARSLASERPRTIRTSMRRRRTA